MIQFGVALFFHHLASCLGLCFSFPVSLFVFFVLYVFFRLCTMRVKSLTLSRSIAWELLGNIADSISIGESGEKLLMRLSSVWIGMLTEDRGRKVRDDKGEIGAL
jgi:hypothetical protein